MQSKRILLIVVCVVIALAMAAVAVSAGDPDDPPAAPEGTYSYDLEDIYQRLSTGAAGTQNAFVEPSSEPGTGTMHTLDNIMGLAPTVDESNGATAANVLAGKTYWGLTAGQWGTATGAMPNVGAMWITPGTTRTTITSGYHNGSGYVEGDADLVGGNIRSGVDLFGVSGTLLTEVYQAGVPVSGQSLCYTTTNESETTCPVVDFPGQDGDMQAGVDWPTPRFTIDAGVVTDNLTGLMWLQDANCMASEYPEFDGDGKVTWQEALDFTAGITATGAYSNCAAGFSDWRLPNVRELQSLIDYSYYQVAVPNTAGTGQWSEGDPFINLQSDYYCSSSSYVHEPSRAWNVVMTDGNLNYEDKVAQTCHVWPVRGGE